MNHDLHLRKQLREEDPVLYNALEDSWETALREWVQLLKMDQGSSNSLAHLINVERRVDVIARAFSEEPSTAAAVKFSPAEKYLLLASALFHDIGRTLKNEGHGIESENIIKENHGVLGIPSYELAASLGKICAYHDVNSKLVLHTTAIDPYGEIRQGLIAAILALADVMDNAFTRVQPRYVCEDHLGFKGLFRRTIRDVILDPKNKMVRTVLVSYEDWGSRQDVKSQTSLPDIHVYLVSDIVSTTNPVITHLIDQEGDQLATALKEMEDRATRNEDFPVLFKRCEGYSSKLAKLLADGELQFIPNAEKELKAHDDAEKLNYAKFEPEHIAKTGNPNQLPLSLNEDIRSLFVKFANIKPQDTDKPDQLKKEIADKLNEYLDRPLPNEAPVQPNSPNLSGLLIFLRRSRNKLSLEKDMSDWFVFRKRTKSPIALTYDMCVGMVLKDVKTCHKALESIRPVLNAAGLTLAAWVLDHEEHLYNSLGEETYEPTLTRKFLIEVLEGMRELSCGVFGTARFSYEELAAQVGERSALRVKTAVTRIGILSHSVPESKGQSIVQAGRTHWSDFEPDFFEKVKIYVSKDVSLADPHK